MYLFTIEGCIGSGKSTFIELLKIHLKQLNGVPVVYIPEPVEEWESIISEDGQNMIQLFYGDNQKYAFSFQMMAYISRLSYLRKAIQQYPKCILISERSLYADYHVFAKMLHANGSIPQENYQIYKKWFDEFIEDIPVSGYIYMKTETEVCFDRCNRRARKGESSITQDYLEQCNKLHDDWLDTEYNVLTLHTNTVDDVDTVIEYISDEIPEHNKYNGLICMSIFGFLACCNIIKIGFVLYHVFN